MLYLIKEFFSFYFFYWSNRFWYLIITLMTGATVILLIKFNYIVLDFFLNDLYRCWLNFLKDKYFNNFDLCLNVVEDNNNSLSESETDAEDIDEKFSQKENIQNPPNFVGDIIAVIIVIGLVCFFFYLIGGFNPPPIDGSNITSIENLDLLRNAAIQQPINQPLDLQLIDNYINGILQSNNEEHYKYLFHWLEDRLTKIDINNKAEYDRVMVIWIKLIELWHSGK